MAVRNVIAVDLGATSGRAMLAVWDNVAQQISLKEIHRFANGFVQQQGGDCWDLDRLEQAILDGIGQLDSASTIIDSIGIDTWGG